MSFPFSSICVFCGSADGLAQPYLNAAACMGRELAARRIRLVYGAGCTGLMGALSNAALQEGGEVIGVAPRGLEKPQLIHVTGLSRLEIVEDIQTRKARMIELADAFIVLPGGYGTLDELFEVLTWSQIGLQRKPIGLLNTNGFYDSLLNWIAHAEEDCFIYPEHRQLFVSAPKPIQLLDALEDHRFPDNLERWVLRETQDGAGLQEESNA